MLTEDGKHLYVSYDEYHNLIEKLALRVYQSGWEFDTILCLARGGMRPGDILTAVEGKHVTDSSSMLNLSAALQPGKRAVLTVLRNGKSLQISVLVRKRPLQARAQAED